MGETEEQREHPYNVITTKKKDEQTITNRHAHTQPELPLFGESQSSVLSFVFFSSFLFILANNLNGRATIIPIAARRVKIHVNI